MQGQKKAVDPVVKWLSEMLLGTIDPADEGTLTRVIQGKPERAAQHFLPDVSTFLTRYIMKGMSPAIDHDVNDINVQMVYAKEAVDLMRSNLLILQ